MLPPKGESPRHQPDGAIALTSRHANSMSTNVTCACVLGPIPVPSSCAHEVGSFGHAATSTAQCTFHLGLFAHAEFLKPVTILLTENGSLSLGLTGVIVTFGGIPREELTQQQRVAQMVYYLRVGLFVLAPLELHH